MAYNLHISLACVLTVPVFELYTRTILTISYNCFNLFYVYIRRLYLLQCRILNHLELAKVGIIATPFTVWQLIVFIGNNFPGLFETQTDASLARFEN